MEQKNRKVINGYSDKDFNFTSQDLEFLQLARDLATQYQEVYNDKISKINSDSLDSSTLQKAKK